MRRGLLLDNGQRTTDYRQRTSPCGGRSFSLDNGQRTTDNGPAHALGGCFSLTDLTDYRQRTTEGGLRTTDCGLRWMGWHGIPMPLFFLFIDNFKKDKI
jgi:hypothetical protein